MEKPHYEEYSVNEASMTVWRHPKKDIGVDWNKHGHKFTVHVKGEKVSGHATQQSAVAAANRRARQMDEGKTFREALRDFTAIAEGRQPSEAPHMIVQLEKHVRNPEMNPLRFKNGQKAKIPEALAHRVMKMHDSMNQSDKQAFVAHISKSIEHLKSGLKGAWKKDTKKTITLAGPKLRKEESDRPEQHTKTDVLVRKHTRLAADALGRAHHLGKDHKDYKKNMAEYERHRKIALGEEHEDDDGWYAHKEMHGSKAISKEDWKKGVRPKKSMKKEEVEQIDELKMSHGTYVSAMQRTTGHDAGSEEGRVDAKKLVARAKKYKGAKFAKDLEGAHGMAERPHRNKTMGQIASDKLAWRSPSKATASGTANKNLLKSLKGSLTKGDYRKPSLPKRKLPEEVEQVVEWGRQAITGPHARMGSQAITPPKVGYKGKTRKPKVQKLDTTPDKM